MRIKHLILFIALPFMVVACSKQGAAPSMGLGFAETSYSALSGWQLDDHSEALGAFLISCESLLKQPATRPMKGSNIAGYVGDWQPACRAAGRVNKGDTIAARRFFEAQFRPIAVTMNGQDEGLFTGYYEPLLNGSFSRNDRFNVPLYKKPQELITINLGDFRPSLKGQNLVGVLDGDRLVPYHDRQEIEGGALDGQNLELLWVDDPVGAFFLHVQGSGRVQLESGEMLSVGYAGKNGHVYRSIGRILINEGEIDPEVMSLQSLRRWLKDNPAERDRILNENPSFVFFRQLNGNIGPYGSAGVVLTAERSLAVDPNQLPLNAPMWLETEYPDPDNPLNNNNPFSRLMIAQDTGGAIKGAIRGDVFWGFGPRAEAIAGRMANRGRYFILLPNALAQKHGEASANE